MARGSTEERTELLKIGLRIAKDHPLFGVGLGAYPFANAQYAPEKGARDTHNTYVNLAAEAGIPALLLFFGLLYLTFRPCHRAILALRKPQPRHSMAIAGMLSALIAFLVAGLFGSYAKILFLYVFMAFTYCLANVLMQPSDVPQIRRVKRGRAL